MPMHIRVDYSVQYFRDMLTALIHRKAAVATDARTPSANGMADAQRRSRNGVQPGRRTAA